MPATNYKAVERCSCGATISAEAYTTADLRETLAAFRTDHRHVVGVLFRSEPAADGDVKAVSGGEDAE